MVLTKEELKFLKSSFELLKSLGKVFEVEENKPSYVRHLDSIYQKIIEINKYQKAYYILSEYWDSIGEEEKPKVDKRLKGLGL